MFFSAFIYSMIAGISTILGTLLVFYRYKWAKHNSVHLISFAAGVMLALAFLHLIPEAVEMGHMEELTTTISEESHEGEEGHHHEGNIGVYILVLCGFVIFYAIESLVSMHPRHDVDAGCTHESKNLSLMSIIGLTFHSLIDGIIITVGFKAGFQIGLLTTTAVILHEIPEGIITTGILLHDNMTKKSTFWFSILVALATPFGAIVSALIFVDVSKGFLSSLLALASGSLIYIAGSDLIPETHHSEKRFNTIILIIGMALLYFMGRFLGSGH